MQSYVPWQIIRDSRYRRKNSRVRKRTGIAYFLMFPGRSQLIFQDNLLYAYLAIITKSKCGYRVFKSMPSYTVRFDSLCQRLMSLDISQGSNKLMPVYFESLSLSQFLRSSIYCNCFKEYFQYIVYILLSVCHVEPAVIYSSHSQHVSNYRMAMRVESGDGSEI